MSFTLSERGKLLAENPARIDTALFMEAANNLYCPEKNPNGKFLLNIAENGLTAPIIQDKLNEILRQKSIPEWVLKYTHFWGHPDVRVEVAKFMEQYLCQCKIEPNSIAFSAGASAVIEATSFVLADEGDVVVIPAPSYPMYTKDFGTKSGMERYDLQTHFNLHEIGSEAPVNTKMLDQTLSELNAKGKRFKILMITSPDNPTGCRYTTEQLLELANWCITNQVHLIVNEIYGLSLIDTTDITLKEDYKEGYTYSSFAQIMAELQSDYLHLWYAFSKDFAMSGMRFGLVHSLNSSFMEGYANANLPHLVSNLTQWLVGELLKDSRFLEQYIQKNQKLLNRSYKTVIDTLKRLDIPFIPSRGSLFVWADFSKYLKQNNDKAEEKLWLNIFDKSGLLLTPGMGFQHQKKGLFRIVFTAVPHDHMIKAMERLSAYLQSIAP